MSDALTRAELKVSAYDRAASWLLSLLVLVGTSVAVLFLVWLSARVLLVPPAKPVPVEVVELLNYSGRGDHAAGFGRDAELGAGDVDEPTEAQAQSSPDSSTQSMADQVAALDTIASDVATSEAVAMTDQASVFTNTGSQPTTVTGRRPR